MLEGNAYLLWSEVVDAYQLSKKKETKKKQPSPQQFLFGAFFGWWSKEFAR